MRAARVCGGSDWEVRGRDEGGERGREERETDDKGFDYSTTANIARHIRADTAGGTHSQYTI